MYGETCIDRSYSKVQTVLRKTDTFDPVCFLYASLSSLAKGKTVKRTLLQRRNSFQSSDKKATCLTRTKMKIFGIFENQRNKLDIFSIFSKRATFLHFKTTIIVFDFILQFCRSAIFWFELYIFFSKCSLEPTKNCLASLKVISDRNLQTILYSSMNYWFQYYDLH